MEDERKLLDIIEGMVLTISKFSVSFSEMEKGDTPQASAMKLLRRLHFTKRRTCAPNLQEYFGKKVVKDDVKEVATLSIWEMNPLWGKASEGRTYTLLATGRVLDQVDPISDGDPLLRHYVGPDDFLKLVSDDAMLVKFHFDPPYENRSRKTIAFVTSISWDPERYGEGVFRLGFGNAK